jgi:hypothetical protein
MKEQKKSILVLAIFMAFIAAAVFLPGLVQSFFPPTPKAQLDAITHEVESLVNKGELDQGQGYELNTIIETAQRMLIKANRTEACDLLQAFINQVQAYINAGKLPATKGQFLIGTANNVISQLSSGSFS